MKLKPNHFSLSMIILALLFGIVQWRSDGFSPSAIKIPLLATPDQSEIHSDFTWPQEFTYLAKGKQAFAFESLDKKYVIKFFDKNRMDIPWYHIFATKKWVNRRKSKQRLYPESYRLAYRLMKEETDLIYVHLGPSQDRLPLIAIQDKADRRFFIDLNQIPFILQKKASQPFLEELDRSKNERSQLRSWIDQYISINKKRIGLSIANKDKHIKDNYRCEKGRLIYIDPGRYYLSSELKNKQVVKEEWDKATYELRAWLKKHAPAEIGYFDASLSKALDEDKHLSFPK